MDKKTMAFSAAWVMSYASQKKKKYRKKAYL
jgi:hypothetical protein